MKKLYFLLLLVSFGMHSQNINFPDPVLKQKLLTVGFDPVAYSIFGLPYVIDANNDNEISVSEASLVGSLQFQSASGITSLVGLHKFTNITRLSLHSCTMPIVNFSIMPTLKAIYVSGEEVQSLNMTGLSLETFSLFFTSVTSVDFSNMNAMLNLQIGDSPVTSVDVTNMHSLQKIYLNKTNITTLDLSNKQILIQALIEENNLTNINLQNSPFLSELYVSKNQLTSLDVSTNTNLEQFACNNNNLHSLDITSNAKLKGINCSNNQLTTLDVSNNRLLNGLILEPNPLEQLFLKNGKYLQSLYLAPITTLKYICADENNIAAYKAKVSSNPLCEVNSYCSFAPGGVNYTINGNSKFDANSNGCDEADIQIKNLKFAITNGTQSGNIIPDASGNYSFPVSAGTHTITPILENPTYFNVLPASTTVTFPTQTSPQTQNFCVIANGVHSDIDVNIIPMTAAVPGFDVTYKIIYRNIGNSIITNGNVVFNYDDSIFDYVTGTASSSLPPYVGTLNWIFLNLQPFETRTIFVTLNLNGPMETPAVNDGNILTLNASSSILGLATDENLNDNTMTLQQTVVNAMDPNDKTCLEGTVVTPSMAGKYVHYLIRFENLGTAPAQNVVVKDMIDTTKFDINSLVSLDASHSFRTNISNPNKVEFIFENIQLPFDDANNDGYIVFKIKTKATLVTGDTFSNSASIYFDYNFPVVTEPAITMMQSLGTTEFGQDANFTIYPNPTNGQLYIDSKVGANLKSISIYNVLGQLIMIVPNAKGLQRVDVASLATGNYIMKIQSDKGNSAVKFIKQ